MTLEQLLERFDMRRPAGRGFNVNCPSHIDREASLNIAEGDDGKLLLHCYAGCATDDILDALDLEWSDINVSNSSEPIAVYSYTDENGNELYQRLRFHPKKFLQRHRVGDEWVWNLKGVRPVLYRLPTVLRAADLGGVVYITEGEKDADRLWKDGIVATTSGGVNSWHDSFSMCFRSGSRVIVIADRDVPGLKHAKQIADSLREACVDATVLQAREGKDVSDHLDAGFTLDELIPVDFTEGLRHYQPMDLFQSVPPVKWVVKEIVVGGEVTLLIGDGGCGKSYFALAMALSVAAGTNFLGNETTQGQVMYVDEEGSPDLALQRLKQLKATEFQKRHLDYLNFRRVDLVREPWKLLEDVQLVKPKLVVIDSHAKVTSGKEENSNNEMGRVWDDGFLPLARDTGAAVLVIHHTSTYEGARDKPRGASQIRNSADQVLSMKINYDDDSRSVWASKPRRMTKGFRFSFEDVGFGEYELVRLP